MVRALAVRTSTTLVPFFRQKRGLDNSTRLYVCRRCGWVWSGARDDPQRWAILGRHLAEAHGSGPLGSSA